MANKPSAATGIDWGQGRNQRILDALTIVLSLARGNQLTTKDVAGDQVLREALLDQSVACRHVENLLAEFKRAKGMVPLNEMLDYEKALIRNQLEIRFPWITKDEQSDDWEEPSGADLISDLVEFYQVLKPPPKESKGGKNKNTPLAVS